MQRLQSKRLRHDSNGNTIGVLGTYADITARKTAEQELENSRRLLELVIDNIPERVFWKDKDLNYLGVNQAFAEDAGLDSPADLIGKSDYDMPWTEWQNWFQQIEEQHTTLALMNFYRSPKADRHWVTAAGCVLDSAAIIASSVQVDRAAMAGVVIRSGFLSLRSIADYFEIPYNRNPHHTDTIQITREEFEAVLDGLEQYNVPLNPDRDYCWDHFVGWRVNYDEIIIALSSITTAPYGNWSSDRARQWLKEDIPMSPSYGYVGLRSDVIAFIGSSPILQ